MKKITFLYVFLLSFAAIAQETITHSTSMDLVATNPMVSCQQDTNDPETPNSASDNKYFRFFDLSDFGIETAWDVQSINFGIQGVNIPSMPNGYPMRVKVYSTPGSSFPTGYPTNFDQLASAVVLATNENNGTIVTANLSATIPTGHNLLVSIEYEAAEQGSGNRLFLAANSAGETAPTYIESEGCGISPSTMATIGFPDVHLILSVTGQENLSINNPALNGVSVYPNPADDFLKLNLPQHVQVEKATLTDMTGKEIEASISNNTIDVSRFTTGVYVLTLTTNEGFATRKIVKQ